MTAAHLLRESRSRFRVVLIERRGSIGEGVAYSTRESAHRLNVPAGNMSAWPDRAGDFMEWAHQRDPRVQASEFLSRERYGDYIRDTLRAAAEKSAAELEIRYDEVRRVARMPDRRWMLHVTQGSSLRADAVVLAVGHSAPSDPIGGNWAGPRTRYVADPWRPFAMNAIQGDEPILILGSGLTAVDTVLSLTEHPRVAKITLISLNGLIPQGHASADAAPLDLDDWVSDLLGTGEGVTALGLSRKVQGLARSLDSQGSDWRRAIDALRSHTPTLWRALSLRERRRFLTRLRPFWEVHRHRVAPAIHACFESLRRTGRVEIIGGRVESAREAADQVHVRLRRRKSQEVQDIEVGWVVNCTGPLPSNRPESNPAIGSLMIRGQLSLDALALGVETGARGSPIAAGGAEIPELFVVGTLRKPDCWESTAVPELREQAAQVARELLQQIECGSNAGMDALRST
jgi:uncharacterized NAD(P)/FAD-binding protein YdhS